MTATGGYVERARVGVLCGWKQDPFATEDGVTPQTLGGRNVDDGEP
jgi:hypothetical protein